MSSEKVGNSPRMDPGADALVDLFLARMEREKAERAAQTQPAPTPEPVQPPRKPFLSILK